jgi:hypothetical protein
MNEHRLTLTWSFASDLEKDTSKHVGPSYLTIRMTRVNDQPSLPPFNLPGSTGNIEEAKEVLMSLVTAVGEYASAGDLSRAVALLLTPMILRMGILSREQCPSSSLHQNPRAEPSYPRCC